MNWRVKEGQSFSAGDILVEIETDKAQIEVEAQDDGVLAKILTPAGTSNVAVGQAIAVMAEEESELSQVEQFVKESGESTPASAKKESKSKKEAPSASKAAQKPGAAPPSSEHSTSAERPPTRDVSQASATLFPSVARLLAEYDIRLSSVTGTGPKGRVLKGDVLKFIKDGKLAKKPRVATEHKTSSAKVHGSAFTLPAGAKATVPRFSVQQQVQVPATASSTDATAALVSAVTKVLRSKSRLDVRCVRNPSFSKDETENAGVASEFVAETANGKDDVEVAFRKEPVYFAESKGKSSVRFKNADQVYSDKGPITMERISAYEVKSAGGRLAAVGITPASNGAYEFSLHNSQVEPTMITIEKSQAARQTRSSQSDILDYLSGVSSRKFPHLSTSSLNTSHHEAPAPTSAASASALPRRRILDELDLLSGPAPSKSAAGGKSFSAKGQSRAPGAPSSSYTLNFSFDARLIDSAAADEFCDEVAKELRN